MISMYSLLLTFGKFSKLRRMHLTSGVFVFVVSRQPVNWEKRKKAQPEICSISFNFFFREIGLQM